MVFALSSAVHAEVEGLNSLALAGRAADVGDKVDHVEAANGDVFASSQAVFFRDSRKQGMLAMGIGARRGILGDRLETGARWYWCA
ncbi:hypothetical protein HMPREF2883_05335 [Actinomyces sp. HMSC075C01]|uniref:Uncharacterized protein n=1 Tax=Actinomyces oris TaxID=544580 RepID=A0A1Q8VQ25_9ACTO|nr:hypothetical protein HMPREF2883_05335 [Actinomyces sp. HMSC075C01]OLO50178.1 hypothetical protein BKH27_13635 [Actinomyces oris]OLO56604.1 hypothetical protein BKH26_05295 [Actinomyces oris]OLO59023.1 hypothetical protein BKH24_09070 [Actinomyces oris]